MYRQIIGTIAVFSLSFLAAMGAESYFLIPTSAIPFDTVGWSSGDRDTRGRMVSSLLQYPLAALPGAYVKDRVPQQSAMFGSSIAGAKRILGTPDYEDVRKHDGTTSMIKFYLGKRGHWQGGQFVLRINFDENERVESFFVGR